MKNIQIVMLLILIFIKNVFNLINNYKKIQKFLIFLLINGEPIFNNPLKVFVLSSL